MKSCSTAPYVGEYEYVFVSFCEKNKKDVFPVIERLARSGCRLYFDSYPKTENDRNSKIADKILTSVGCIAFVSDEALDSGKFRRELNFALSEEKTVVAVFLEDVFLSAGMEMQFSAVQCISRYKYTEEEFMNKLFAADITEKCRGNENLSVTVNSPESYTENLSDLYACDEIKPCFIGNERFFINSPVLMPYNDKIPADNGDGR